MGLLVGRVEGSKVKFFTLKVLKRLTKEKDRVEIDPSQLMAGAEFAASLKVGFNFYLFIIYINMKNIFRSF
jgi:hypothetical protein